jgi:hypothetical protein
VLGLFTTSKLDGKRWRELQVIDSLSAGLRKLIGGVRTALLVLPVSLISGAKFCVLTRSVSEQKFS